MAASSPCAARDRVAQHLGPGRDRLGPGDAALAGRSPAEQVGREPAEHPARQRGDRPTGQRQDHDRQSDARTQRATHVAGRRPDAVIGAVTVAGWRIVRRRARR